jgi:YHS domain-containing protein
MKAKDPVCGMMVDTDTARFSGTYDGTTVYFCAAVCQQRFEAKRAPR